MIRGMMSLRLVLAAAGVAVALAQSSLFVETVPKLDVCGVCDGMDMTCTVCTTFTDCNGDCGGSKLVDECGVCGGDSSSCSGCLDVAACNRNLYATIGDPAQCTYGTLDNEYVV
jgi:hypothetical protein